MASKPSNIEDMRKGELLNVHSAVGVGAEAFRGGSAYGFGSMFDNKNVNRCSSLHERRFNAANDYLRNHQRLEPLVQRRQKISRISVK